MMNYQQVINSKPLESKSQAICVSFYRSQLLERAVALWARSFQQQAAAYGSSTEKEWKAVWLESQSLT